MLEKNKTDQLAKLIKVARGLQPADIVIRNARVVNVFTGKILNGDVAISQNNIAGVGSYSGINEIDAGGRFVSPGLIDSHLHLESSMLTPCEFTRAVIPRGTTSVVIDPHEIANVAGIKGITEILTISKDLPVLFYVMASSCVPASKLETSGAQITAKDIAELYRHERVLGLAEVMDFLGVLEGDSDVLEKISVSSGKPIDGHAPGLTGKDLNAYCAAGMESDHETTRVEEGLEKLRDGMHLMLRQGSAARNLSDLSGLVTAQTANRCLLVTDDLLPTDIMTFGHLDHLLRMLVKQGIDPVTAISMATINAAQRFRLHRVGAIAPGYRADLVIFDDLSDFHVSTVISSGKVVVKEGRMAVDIPSCPFSTDLMDSVHVGAFDIERLNIKAQNGGCRIIMAKDGQLTTDCIVERPSMLGDQIIADVDRDILKVAVVERHKATGNVGVGLIRGFDLKKGAMASSVAHDAHNIIVVGASDSDMVAAVREVERLNGGLVVVADGQVTAELPLPVAGLVSDLAYEEVCLSLQQVEDAAKNLGSTMIHPFMTLSFMALEVIPSLKITDRGLVDVEKGEYVGLWNG